MTTIADKVKEYLDLRSELDVARKQFAEKEKQIKPQLESIMLDVMTTANDLGVDNFKTQYGTAYKNLKTSYKILDWEEFTKWAVENDALHTVQKRVTKAAVDEIVDETGDIPPGLDVFSEVTFNFRAQ